MRVLIADDDHDGADILGLLFEDAGCEVRVVHSGFEAIAVSPTFRPQLVVLDLGMPGMDGFEAARRLGNEASSKDAVFVAYTALPRSTVVEQFQGSPFAFFVQKPSDFDRFERILGCCRPAREDGPVNRVSASDRQLSACSGQCGEARVEDWPLSIGITTRPRPVHRGVAADAYVSNMHASCDGSPAHVTSSHPSFHERPLFCAAHSSAPQNQLAKT